MGNENEKMGGIERESTVILIGELTLLAEQLNALHLEARGIILGYVDALDMPRIVASDKLMSLADRAGKFFDRAKAVK